MAALRDAVSVDWWLVVSYGDGKTHQAHLKTAKSLAKIHPGAHCLVAHTLNTALAAGGAANTNEPFPGFVLTPTGAPQHVDPAGSQFVIPLIFKAKTTIQVDKRTSGHLKVVK